MKKFSVIIKPFEDQHQPAVDKLLHEISNEFSERIFSPNFRSMQDLAAVPGNLFWIAETDGKLRGTVGLREMTNENIALKSLFLFKDSRGGNVAIELVTRVEQWAREHKKQCIYLGTMSQFRAAQRFYEKHGYVQINVDALPADFPANPVDTVFFKKTL